MDYTEAIKLLEKSGEKFEFPVKWGIDLQSEHERYLTEKVIHGPVAVVNYPKDIKAFRAVASAAGYDFRLLDEVMRINDDQCRRFIAKVRNALWILKGKRLAVLGLAFKGGTDDIRQSQAIVIIQMLLKEGCSIAAYDPAAIEKTKSSRIFSAEAVTFATDPYQAARDADAVLVLTDWEEFGALDIARLRSALKYPIMVDGRNLFKPEALAAAGFTYVSVGRAEVSGKQSLSMATPAD